MTTELLFRDDAYSKTAAGRVVAVHDRGIELDRTIFYPQGGGQVGVRGGLQVAGIGGQDLLRARVDGGGDGLERPVLGAGVELGQRPRRALRGAADVGDGLGGGGHAHRVPTGYRSTK